MTLFDKKKYPAPVECLYISAGLYLLFRYFWLMDDAFVYFRYADNLIVRGLGLVYNAGEYVEGFSSPLWMSTIALLRIFLPDYLFIIKLSSVVFFTAYCFLIIRLNRKMAPPGTSVVNLPLAFLAVNYGALSYFSSGLETPMVQFCAAAYALFIFLPGSRLLCIILALSPLVRHELLLPLLIAVAWSYFKRKKTPWLMIGTAVVVLTGWMGFRIYYYAELLPNTFYLKDMVNIKQGFYYLHDTFGAYHIYLILLIMTGALMLLHLRRQSTRLPERAMLLLTALPVIAYAVKIGGAHVHFVYLAFPFTLIICSFGAIPEHLFAVFLPEKHKWAAPATGIIIALISFSFYPGQLDKHPVKSGIYVKFKNRITDAEYARQNLKEYLSSKEWDRIEQEHRKESKRLESESEKPYGKSSTMADSLCAFHYRNLYKRVVHSLGLTDAFLARMEVEQDRPAHKYELKIPAHDIAGIYDRAENIGRGMFKRAVEQGYAPDWVKENLKTVETIERKIFNRHEILENTTLAFSFPPRIKPGELKKKREEPPAMNEMIMDFRGKRDSRVE